MLSKNLVFPWIKRFKQLFISMFLLMGLGMSFSVGMINGYVSFKDDYASYVEEYKAPSGYLETSNNLVDYKNEIKEAFPEIEHIESSLIFKAATYIEKDNRSGYCNVFTYDDPYKSESGDGYYKYYERDSVPEDGLKNPIYVEYSYAKNNNLKAGDKISIGYLGCYATATIEKVVSFPDLIEYGPVNGLLAGTTDFGYICSTKSTIFSIISELKVQIDKKYVDETDPKYEEVLKLKAILGTMISLGGNAVNEYEIYLPSEQKDNTNFYLQQVKEFLESKGVNITSHYTYEDTSSYKVVDGMTKSIKVLAVVLPICLFIVALFVVALFLNQMINSLQRDIGILKAIGVKSTTILGAISLFVLICSVFSILVGASVGMGLSFLFSYLLKRGLGLIGLSLNAAGYTIPLCSAIVLVLFQIAGLFSCRSILKVSPKEAMVEQNDSLKQLPKKVENALEKATPIVKLSINSTLRNINRVITSIVSLFTSIIFISIGTSLMFSKEKSFKQSFDSLINYNAQIVMVATPSDSFRDDLMENASVTEIQDILISQMLTLESSGNMERINIIAFKDDEIRMLKIASSDGESTQEMCKENEIILDTTYMESLGLHPGDDVMVNGYPLKVASETKQYAISTCYCTYGTLQNIAPDKTSVSFFVNYSDLETFEKHLSSYYYAAYPIITDYLKSQKETKNSSIDYAAIILNVTFVAFGLLIVTIMSVSNLQSQKKNLSILRALGVSMRKTSNYWLVQLLSHYLTASLLGFPAAYFSCKTILKLMATKAILFPFSDKLLVFVITYSLVLLFVMVSHLFVTRKIKQWNIADNTKSKE